MSNSLEFVTSGDLLLDPFQARVIPVNCEGVMGKGLARAFREHRPHLLAPYRDLCARGNLAAGRIGVLLDRSGANPETDPLWVLFPTKVFWRLPSEMAYIESGLAALVTWASARRPHGLALPALGCGEGGLPWPAVKAALTRALSILPPDVPVRVYAPR